MLKLEDLQKRGLVTNTKQYSAGIGWGYKILRYNGQLGCMAFSSQIYSQEELENPKNQKEFFGSLIE